MSQKAYPHIGQPRGPLHAAAWDERYSQKDTPWDHGEPAPGLIDFLAGNTHPPGKVLVPGCGMGHDCVALARHGFDVTGLDISAVAIQNAKQFPNVRYMVGDFTRAMSGQFDWIFEHTCFCAIHPDCRNDYVKAARQALKPNGLLLAIFFVIEADEGPPFGTNRKELCDRFSPCFTLVEERVPRSWPNRQGEELLMLWRKNHLIPPARLSQTTPLFCDMLTVNLNQQKAAHPCIDFEPDPVSNIANKKASA